MELKKYLIIAGCSYSHQSINTIRQIINEPNIEFISIGTPSASNEYISNSIIFLVEELLKNQIPSENILVINNFTQVGRENPIVPKEIQNEIESSLSVTQELNYFDFKYCFYNSFVKIKNRMYYLMVGAPKISKYVSKWISSVETLVQYKLNPIYFFENYLTQIVLFQTFCKKNNIKCISYMMNNVFEGWYDDFSHIYTKNKKWELPSMENTKHISKISDITETLWNMINLNDIVFYKTDKNKYGGIDEYFVSKFSDKKYLQDTPESDYMFFGNHPKKEVYEMFTMELMKDKIEEWKSIL